MEQQTKPKRRPSIEVRCPKCRMREIWHHLPRGGDRCRWCGHLFEDYTYRKVGPGETSRMSSCTTSKRLLASFCEEADYLEWLKAEYDDGTVEWEER